MIDPRRLRCANHEGRQIRPVVGGGAAVPDRRKADAQSRAPKVTLPGWRRSVIRTTTSSYSIPAETLRAFRSAS
jgi:hypothetical protein